MNRQILEHYRKHVWANQRNINTRRVYTDHARVFLNTIDKPLKNITQDDVNTYLTTMQDTKYRNGNVVRFWAVRKFLQWAGIEKLELPKVTPVDAGKIALNETETQKLLDTVPTLKPLHRLVFYLEYDAIRRPAEVRNLQIHDRYRDILNLNTKTGKKSIIMTHRLMEAWDDYLKHQRPIATTPEEDQYLILIEAHYRRGYHQRYNNSIDKIIRGTK